MASHQIFTDLGRAEPRTWRFIINHAVKVKGIQGRVKLGGRAWSSDLEFVRTLRHICSVL